MGDEVKIAVVGAGPAGIYAVDALLKRAEVDVEIDIFDRLPAPYGLVRYGVAPDHPNIKSVIRVLQRVFEDPKVRFLGCVEFGVDVTRDQLRSSYDAVVYASGASVDRPLGIPGESLPGSHPATEFVAWYSGHPDSRLPMRLDDIESVAVIGVGNVALDVARILAKTADDLGQTDAPSSVLDTLRTSTVKDIYVIGRRSPAFAKFTSKELREMGELANASVHVEPDEVSFDAEATYDRATTTNLSILGDWAENPHNEDKPRRLRFRFGWRPVEILGSDRVEGLRCERTRTDSDGRATATGEYHDFPVQCVLRAVGYRSVALPGVPFDAERGTVRNALGRVLNADGSAAAGEYVAGWLKRGPTGVIGTNKSDASETVTALLEDLEAGRIGAGGVQREDILSSLEAKPVGYDGWLKIDAEELARGTEQGRERAKIGDWETLLQLTGGSGSATSAQ